ncbi:MAG: metallophosphoesterase [Myxococcaceae bacterium]|nr:metallophosphoesterase [Myxococcaceae bacterium]
MSRLTHGGRVLELPAHGILLVGTDLQGNLADGRKLLERFEAEGPDAQLVLTGDVVHGPHDDLQDAWPDFLGTPYRDETPALLELVWQAQARFPGRVHALLGNHEHSHVGGPVTSKFHDDEAQALEARLGEAGAARLRAWVAALPWVATSRCGVVLCHAAPGARFRSLSELERAALVPVERPSIDAFFEDEVLGRLLWARRASEADAEAFLRACGGNVAIFGHDVVREGYAVEGAQQLCVSTSFGLFDADKRYVRLELASHYDDARSVEASGAILPLYG